MYGTILPALQELDPIVSVPKAFYADDTLIVMENLRVKGFDIANWEQGEVITGSVMKNNPKQLKI